MNHSPLSSPGSTFLPRETSAWTEPLTLQIQHQTLYHYEGSVTESYNEARLHPVTDPCQTCTQFHLEVRPEARIREFPDAYDNDVQYIDLPKIHATLEVIATSIVQTRSDDRGALSQNYPKNSLADPSIQIECFEYLQESTHIDFSPLVIAESEKIVKALENDIWIQAWGILSYVHTNISYQSQSTHVETRPDEVLACQQGVCQDFAHLMIAMCRAQGIPARYISGYFYQPERPPEHAEASHAWVEIYLPNFGWKGLDPTHQREVDTRYVKLASGRDYADIRPLSGSYRGKGNATMDVFVKVQHLP